MDTNNTITKLHGTHLALLLRGNTLWFAKADND